MPARALQTFLDSHQAKYVTIRHSPPFTAQEIAASAHISGKQLAKTVMGKLDAKLAMAVLPPCDAVLGPYGLTVPGRSLDWHHGSWT
jgi:Ala-tRNA(Pro) deacylase